VNTIDVLLQGEAIADIHLITLAHDAELIVVLEEAVRLRGGAIAEEAAAFLVFLQDEDEPLRHAKLPRSKPGQPLCLHVHRCRKVKVDTSFNGQIKEVSLAPSRTVGATKTYVATKLFGMTPHDAAEHVLQIAGTDEQPDADTHIGALAEHCEVAFDLVPLVRVEG
jgi:hypothetical protein